MLNYYSSGTALEDSVCHSLLRQQPGDTFVSNFDLLGVDLAYLIKTPLLVERNGQQVIIECIATDMETGKDVSLTLGACIKEQVPRVTMVSEMLCIDEDINGIRPDVVMKFDDTPIDIIPSGNRFDRLTD